MDAISPMKNKEELLLGCYQLFNNAFDVDYLFENFLKLIYLNFKNLSKVQVLREIKDINQFTVLYEITSSERSMLAMRIGSVYKNLKELNNETVKLSNIKDDFLNSYDIHSLFAFDLGGSNSYESFLLLCSEDEISLTQDEIDFLLLLLGEFKKCCLRLELLEKSIGDSKRLRLQNELLREQERLKTDFINNISHELRTPLSGILGFSKILSSNKDTAESKEDIAKHIQDSASRLSNLVCDLVQATGSHNSWVVNWELIDINEIAKDSVEEFSLLKKDFKIKYEASSEFPKIKSDSKLIRQVIDNLISNAIKYSVNKKEVAVKLGVNKDKSEVVFSIADSGVGVRKEELSRLFDRFYRSSNSEIKSIPGSGLGLTISKEIVETLGGKITVESELGKGSKFIVILPCT
jgi:signal transduction histidine kinase